MKDQNTPTEPKVRESVFELFAHVMEKDARPKDPGYLSPAPFDVEGFVDDVVRMVDENLEPRRTDVLGHDVISGKMRFRKALEAHAEKIGSETPGSVLD